MKPVYRRVQLLVCAVLLTAMVLTACGKNGASPAIDNTPEPPSTSSPTQTATSQPKTLVVCLGEEPQSLYLYKGSSRAMWSVLEAIYDGPIDTSNFELSPVILKELPTLENGGVTLTSVAVGPGDEVANVDGDLVTLEKGVKVFPEGCTSLDCAVEWDGKSELSLVQMSAKFSLLDGIKWSDGVALTADDSVYSFTITADPATKVSKNLLKRTKGYLAVDPRTIQWTGKPGYLTFNPSAFFWIPQPEHILKDLTPEQLNSADQTNKKPIGWGPYQIDEWTSNDHIRLIKNPNYFRASEGLPKFDVVVYRFLPSLPEPDLSPMVTGECDIMDTSVGLESQIQPVRELENAGKLKAYFGQGPEWELINFGIKPASYDVVYNPYLDRPDFFGDLRVRKAVEFCIDREKIINEVLFSQSKIPTSYLPPAHPYAATDIPLVAHDAQQGIQLLEEVGWRDTDGDPSTPRVSGGVEKVLNGTELTLNYYVTESELHTSVTQIVVDSLKECGVKVTPIYLPVADMYGSGPKGVVFGRNFDLAELAWSTGRQPPCFLYSSSEIPSDKNSWLGTKFGGVNITGYSNPDYDEACMRMLSAGLNREAFDAENQKVQQMMADELPVIPLFYHIKAMVARVDLCGLTLDVSARSPLNTLETLDIQSTCANK
jgi:peptide/nickel transport system substrate-binding protein